MATTSENAASELHPAAHVETEGRGRQVSTGESSAAHNESVLRQGSEEEIVQIDSDDEGDSSSDSDGPQYGLSRRNTNAMIEETERQELQRIATVLTRRQSTATTPMVLDEIVTMGENDPALQPQNAEFDLAKWLQRIIRKHRAQGHAPEAHAGIVYKDLNVFGTGEAVQVQQTVASLLLSPLRPGSLFSFGKKTHKQILHNFDGVLRRGELLIVLGRPGSGCSTLLKTICGELRGLNVDKKSVISYQGIPQKKMKTEFKGEVIYNQEVRTEIYPQRQRCLSSKTNIAQVDRHFPHLTVGQTLEFAASVRMPSHRLGNMPRDEYARYLAQVVMAVCGLSHTYNTKVGDDFIRGVSGGERKRVSIAEMMLAGSPFLAWDNR